MSEELKPCPCCSEEVSIEETENGYSIECECGCSMWMPRKEWLITNWNTRYIPDPTPEEIEAVAEAISAVLAGSVTFSDKQLAKAALTKFIELRIAK